MSEHMFDVIVDAAVRAHVKKLVQVRREKLEELSEVPATYANPLGNVSALTLGAIRTQLDEYEKTITPATRDDLHNRIRLAFVDMLGAAL